MRPKFLVNQGLEYRIRSKEKMYNCSDEFEKSEKSMYFKRVGKSILKLIKNGIVIYFSENI